MTPDPPGWLQAMGTVTGRFSAASSPPRFEVGDWVCATSREYGHWPGLWQVRDRRQSSTGSHVYELCSPDRLSYCDVPDAFLRAAHPLEVLAAQT